MQKVPVVHQDGTPLMPCSPAKARKLLKQGAAVKKWTKTGIFYIQLTTPTSKHTQQMAMGIDPGAHYDGYCIATKEQMQLSGMLVVKNRIAKKMEQRRNMRRARRFRKTRRRPKRFTNRLRKEGWLPPSIKAKVELRIRLIESLLKIYPITDFAVEDMKVDGNRLKGEQGRQYYTWTMLGKSKLYAFLKSRGNLCLYDPEDTRKAREINRLEKTHKKGELVFSSQAVDGLALCWLLLRTKNLVVTTFMAWRRPEMARRQLHVFQPAKSGVRKPYGGSFALGFKKNTVVWYKGKLYRTGGTTKERLSLHSFDFENKRVMQNAKPEECQKVFQQTWFVKKVS
ncbi:RRXRR domain-containing protein [Microaerobacter geothermalis]|uniref:RRXRR domain-containing protein n=1 Tax=Microaerobacter geothermalis TaxID=674972 RepID=UPI001F2B940B|nr:RRXRR domain-containing protein [Microaerobacter geothermalis]MCF6094320.1 RRXRR domain-containing protein [Microaerobacter geothermalis]